MISKRAVGICQMLVSGLCFGFLGIFGKYAYAAGLRPGEFLSLRFLLASIFIFGFCFFARRPAFKSMTRSDIFSSVCLGCFGYAVFSSCYFMALTQLSASLTVLLLYTYPVIVCIAAWFFFKEKMDVIGVLTIPIVLTGLICLVWNDLSFTHAAGLSFGVASSVFYAFYVLGSKRLLKSADPLISVAIIQMSAGIILSILNLRDIPRVVSILEVAWPILLATVFISTVFAMAFFIMALQKLKASEASILGTLEPLSAVVLASFFLQEKMTGIQVLGGSLVLGSLVAISLRSQIKSR